MRSLGKSSRCRLRSLSLPSVSPLAFHIKNPLPRPHLPHYPFSENRSFLETTSKRARRGPLLSSTPALQHKKAHTRLGMSHGVPEKLAFRGKEEQRSIVRDDVVPVTSSSFALLGRHIRLVCLVLVSRLLLSPPRRGASGTPSFINSCPTAPKKLIPVWV